MSAGTWKVCSICRTDIPFEADFYRCSVSTCNRPRLALFFCSLTCWEAHLPDARHRDPWAEPAKAPTKAQHEVQEAEEAEADRRERRVEAIAEARTRSGPTHDERGRRLVDQQPRGDAADEATVTLNDDDLPRDVLIVVSKLKKYVKARSGFNTSDNAMKVLSDEVRRLCDKAIREAGKDGRKTVMDRDFLKIVDRR